MKKKNKKAKWWLPVGGWPCTTPDHWGWSHGYPRSPWRPPRNAFRDGPLATPGRAPPPLAEGGQRVAATPFAF
jgi:hypothetical protein